MTEARSTFTGDSLQALKFDSLGPDPRSLVGNSTATIKRRRVWL